MAGPVSHRTPPLTGSRFHCALNLVIGFPRHGGENQQWQTIYVDGGWHIKNVGSGDLYLNLDNRPADNVRVVATQQPFIWHLWDDEKVGSAIRYVSSHC